MANEPSVTRVPVVDLERMTPSLKTFFDDVFYLLAQGDTSRQIVEKAQKLGARIQYDPAFCQMMGAEAAYDPMGQVIYFDGRNKEPLAFAMTLCHELRHFIHGKEKAVQVDSDWAPMSMLKLALAAEADTHAHELQMAFELAARKNPQGQSLFPQALDTAAQRLKEVPDIQAIIDDGRAHPEKIGDGRLMADFFKAFYASCALRYGYEDVTIHSIKMFPNALANPKQYQGALNSDQIKAAIASADRPYILDHLKDVDLDGPFYASVYPTTAQQLAFLKAARDSRIGPNAEPGWKPDFIYSAVRDNPRIVPPQP